MGTPRFTGRQITTMVVAACLTIIAFPVGVFAKAALSSVTVADAKHPSHKAAISSTGRLAVSDGSGSLTVDGTVSNHDVTQTAALFTGTITPGNGDAATRHTASYGTVRISVKNNQATACSSFLIYSHATSSGSDPIVSTLVTDTISNNSTRTYLLTLPGPYTTVATFGCTLDLQIFGRA